MRKEYTYEREIDYPAQIRVMRKQIRALEKEVESLSAAVEDIFSLFAYLLDDADGACDDCDCEHCEDYEACHAEEQPEEPPHRDPAIVMVHRKVRYS